MNTQVSIPLPTDRDSSGQILLSFRGKQSSFYQMFQGKLLSLLSSLFLCFDDALNLPR